MPLFNICSNKLDNLVNSSDKENIINGCQNRDVMSLKLLVIKKNSVVGHTEIDKATLERNRDTGYTKIGKNVLRCWLS